MFLQLPVSPCYNHPILDINFIRENKDIVKNTAGFKGVPVDIDALLTLDEKRRRLLSQIEDLRTQQNRGSELVSSATGAERDTAIAEMKEKKEELQKLEDSFSLIEKEFRDLMLQVPNVPNMSVPAGKSDEDNQEIKVWGEKTKFDFEPKSHIEILQNLNMVDFERGAKVYGFRGYFLTEDAVRLSVAIWQYAMDFFSQKEFVPVIAPAIVREENLYGTGHLPSDAEDVYKTQDEIGTPFCITADYDTLTNNSVTVRERDSMQQERVAVSDLQDFIKNNLE